jgi:repressor LexA
MSYLTPSQKRVYEHVVQFRETYGYSPTIRDIQRALGYAGPSTVQKHIKILVRKGYLKGAGRSLAPGERVSS